MSVNPVLFGSLLAAAFLFFLWNCWQRLALVTLGGGADRFDRPGERFKRMLLFAFGQKRVLARPFGVNHAVIFWAFLILLLANGSFLVEGLFPTFTLERILPAGVYHGLTLLFDLASLLALAAVVVAVARRLFFKPSYLDSAYVKGRSVEGFMILSFIATLMVAFFCLNGVRIALGDGGGAMPVSALFAALLSGNSPAALEGIGVIAWWVHALVLLAFICYLPLSKHMHILTAIPNCFFQDLNPVSLPPREEFIPGKPGKSYGVGRVDDFSWKDLLDGFTCTECGRCQDVCPANATGKPLNPRQIVHSIKSNLLANGNLLKAGRPPLVPLVGEEGEGTTTEDAIWSCTTCGACLVQCPVLIEQMPKIIKLRRHRVEMLAAFPEELLSLFENMEQRSNPWGIAPGERTKWTGTLEVKPFQAGVTEYLFYVGCAGAFDSRAKHVTVALATLLDAAGVSWGILGRDELCCGDSVRRLGNEYVFDRMARANVARFKEQGVKKIVTLCPHCFSTLKNDYRQYGLDLEVLHHSRLLEQLVAQGRLKPAVQNGQGKLLFHDSCYLGRHNDTYDAPRAVITAATGSAPGEFGRSRENGFCCGAGGGRMWMEEQLGSRINLDRVKEALEQEPDTLCVSCPYCMTMLEDGLKDQGAEQVRVMDIAEIMAEAMVPR